MAGGKKDDARQGKGRYVDQPGQYINVTPSSVRKKQENGWQELKQALKKQKAQGKK